MSSGQAGAVPVTGGATPAARRLALGCALVLAGVAWPSISEGGKGPRGAVRGEPQNLFERGVQRAREWHAAVRTAKSLRGESLGLEPSRRQNAGDRVARKRFDRAMKRAGKIKRYVLAMGGLAVGLLGYYFYGFHDMTSVAHIINWSLANPVEGAWLLSKKSHAVWPVAAGLLSSLALRLPARTKRVVRLHQSRRQGRKLDDNTVRWLDRQLRKRKWRGQKVIELDTENTSSGAADDASSGQKVLHLQDYWGKTAAK